MKFKKEMRTNPMMCAKFLKNYIGRKFEVLFSLEYPHGRMVSARLLSVREPDVKGWGSNVEFEAEFPDGYKANYCMSADGFFCEFERQF